jgi:hypothetical protein
MILVRRRLGALNATHVYADTSVFGGIHDDEFREPSRVFFERVKSGQFVLVTSAVVQREKPPDNRSLPLRRSMVR